MNQQIKTDLANDSTRPQALDKIGQWAKDTCLLYGADSSTAYIVAAMLVEGIQNTWEEPKERAWKRKSPRKKKVTA